MTRRLALALLALGCTRSPTPPPDGPVEALAALHRALTAGGDVRAVSDTEALAQAELLQRLTLLHDLQEEHVPLGVTEQGWRRALDDLHAHNTADEVRRAFQPAVPLLGNGRCTVLGPAPLPDALAPLASPRPTWPAFVRDTVRPPLEARARRARAVEARCDEGRGTFRAVFLPRSADDRALVVVRVGTP